MLQRLVDCVLALVKESVKTFTYEFVNNVVRFINGVSALLLALLPGKASILEGIHGWELRPTFRGPRFPRWMEHGVSSFNKFVHEFSIDTDDSSGEEYVSGEEDNDLYMAPASPMSQVSGISGVSNFNKYDEQRGYWLRTLFLWIWWPVALVLGIPSYFYRAFLIGRNDNGTTDVRSSPSPRRRPMKSNSGKDHIVYRTTDKRRGVVEDVQLGIEIFIEAIFDIFHKCACYLISPFESCRRFWSWLFAHDRLNQGHLSNVSVPTTSLGDENPIIRDSNFSFSQSMNTDARTCQDVITELGYPYEAIRVVTPDGYFVLLERIPRHDARKVVYLQHGIMDSSMGWVSNGVVGSPAFAAYDQGYDVFLGNLRGLVSRDHIDKKISSRRYWKYSINEHGTSDIPAMIQKIHDIKTAELKTSDTDITEEFKDQPYRLSAICHSLGGAAILMYILTCRMEEKPHRISKLILLSPAGFHGDSTLVFTCVQRLVLLLEPILGPLLPGIYIPTWFCRMLLNKLARDFHNYPALGGLVQTLMSYIVGGDSSNWVGVIGLPHYNMNDMPGVSFRVAHHLAQMMRAKKFIMYDYGSAAANMEAYGSPEPIDLGKLYHLIDVPVDLVAGRKDRVILPSMVRKHYKLMKNAGVEVSYNEFEYAHLDFTFSHREELLAYVMSRLLLAPDENKRLRFKPQKLIKSSNENTEENTSISPTRRG